MPLKRTFLFLLSLLIIISPFFAVNLSAAEPLTSYAADISRPVKVGVYENEPKIFTDKNGNVSGFWPDIINNIAASEGWEIEWVHGSWEECLGMLANGEIDIMPDVTYTEERAQLYDFSGEALLVSWSRIYTARGVTIQSILDLEGKTVAVLKGSVNVEGPEGIKELANAFDVDCSYMELDSYIEVFEAADNGQADAAVVNKDFGNSHAADYNIEMTGIIFQPSQIHFAFNQDAALTPLLIETIDSYIAGFKADQNSVYYNALEKWLSVEAIEKAVIPVWLWWVVGISVAVMFLLAAGAFILNLMVKQKTRQLSAEVDKQIQAEKKYSALVEKSNDGIIVIQDGIIKFGNGVITKMTGFTLKETTGKALVDFVSPRYKELVSQRYARRMSGEDVPNKYEIEINRKGGKVLAAEINSSIIEYEGRPADMAIIRDITERKQAEEQIAENQARYRSLFENSNDAILLTVPDGRILAANPAACRMFGRSEEEICQLGRSGIVDTSDPALAKALEERRRTGEFIGELTFVRGDNSRFIGEVGSRLFYDKKGNAETTMIIRDITQRKEAEEKLKESEAKYRLLVENVPVGVIIIRNGKVLFANSQDERITGYTLEELQSMNSFDIVYDEDRSKVIEYAAMRARGEPAPDSYTVRIIRRDGTLRWLRRNVARIDWLGEPASLLIDLDITEQMETEKALEKSEQRFRQVADNSDEWIWEVDTEGMFVYCSSAVETILGFSPEELVGKKYFYDLYAPDVREDFIKYTIEAAEQKQSFRSYANPNIHKNGTVVMLDTNAFPILDKDGNLLGYRGVDKDVTERMKAEEKLRSSYTAFKAIKEGIIVTDMNGVITEWNEASEEIHEIPASEALGKKLYELIEIVKPSMQERQIEFAKLMQQGYMHNEQLIMVNGKEKWTETSLQIVKNEEGNNSSVLSIVSDITQRKKIEQELADEAIRRRILVEQSRDGIVILDQDGGVYESNKRFAEMIGYSDEEVKELHVWDWEAAASREQLLGMLNTVDEKGDHFETKHRRKDGSVYDVEISTNAALFAGQKLIFCVCRDITERKKAEAALLDEATRRRMLIEKSRDGIVIIDQDGGVYEANQRFAEMLGYSSEEIKKLHIWDWDTLIPREQLLEMLKSLDEEDNQSANEERQKGLYFETKHRRKDGSFLDVEINSNAATFAGQKLMFSVSRDITERKRAEAAVRVSEERYRTLFETMQQGVVFWGWDGKLISANKATEKILGLTLAQMKGKTPAEVIPFAIKEEGSPFPKDSYPSALALKNGKPEKDILMGVFNPRDDKYRWVVVNAMPQFKENEKEPYQVYTTFNDITQIKEIERALIQSESNLRQSLNSWETTFNSIKNAICLLALDGSIIRCNQAMNDMLGKSDEEITGRKCFEIVHGTKKHIAGCPHLKVVQSGHRETAEIAIDDKWYYVIVDPIFDSEGKVAGSIHTMDDITDRKNMEDRMIMADRLASIGELSSGIAHEVNNPLTGVIGITQLLLSREDLPDDIVKDLNIVNGEAQRAAKVVKNLLIFARKHANEAQFSSVTQAIEKVLELRAYDQKNNNIEVIRDFAPDLPHIVMDYFQIQQVFLNIIINAEFAMKEAHNGGTLTIKTEKAREMVRISFTDDGPGIPRKNLKHIFDPFFTTKEVGKGTGLGLSICHGIISQHHGNIYAKSEHGKGATFVIELPINQPEKAEEVSNG
jgi:PAS domain S-box-containing protein